MARTVEGGFEEIGVIQSTWIDTFLFHFEVQRRRDEVDIALGQEAKNLTCESDHVNGGKSELKGGFKNFRKVLEIYGRSSKLPLHPNNL